MWTFELPFSVKKNILPHKTFYSTPSLVCRGVEGERTEEEGKGREGKRRRGSEKGAVSG